MFTSHHLSHIRCPVSGVRCQVSGVRCKVSFYFYFFSSDKVVELVGGGSVINGAYPVQFLHACYECILVSVVLFLCFFLRSLDTSQKKSPLHQIRECNSTVICDAIQTVFEVVVALLAEGQINHSQEPGQKQNFTLCMLVYQYSISPVKKIITA